MISDEAPLASWPAALGLQPQIGGTSAASLSQQLSVCGTPGDAASLFAATACENVSRPRTL